MILRKEEEEKQEEEETKVQQQQTKTLWGMEHNTVQVMGKKNICIHKKQRNGNRDDVGKRGNNTDKGHYFCRGICRCPDNEQSKSQLDDVHDRKG